MRDILITMFVIGSLPLTLVRPYIGIVMWFLVSYMNFHRMSWGFAYDLQVAMMVGVTTLTAWVITQDKKSVPATAITVILGMFILWCGVTTVFAIGDEAFGRFQQFAKIVLMTYVTISLMQTPERLRILIWVTVVSLGYFSVKGGLFTLATAGQYRVWGPPDTFVEDNNALAMAVLMVVPLMVYLARTIARKWGRLVMYGCTASSIIAVVGSYSRGALLGLIALSGMLWWRSKKRLLIGVLGTGIIAAALPLLPQQWFDRMDTIQNYEDEGSAVGRLEIWAVAIDIAARRPLLGGGFRIQNEDFAYENQPADFHRRSFHSIYFEVLATQGYPGLLIFLSLGAAAYLTTRWIKAQTKDRPDLQDEYQLAIFMQCSIVVYAVSGAFQNLATYDLYYGLLAIIVIARQLVVEKLKVAVPSTDGPMAAPAPETAKARSFIRTQPAARSFLRN